MATKHDCLDALRKAAEHLGESPTKQQYEELGLTPASATIIKHCGGWNAAKEDAGLETFDQARNGPGVDPKPDRVDLPPGTSWEQLTPYQRWYHKNAEQEIEKKERRRARLRRWLHRYKRDECACERCGEGDPACLDFHHIVPEEKSLGIAKMIAQGYAERNILTEIEKCEVLCSNCHRKEHYSLPGSLT
ncbi:homing endonuclease associated repeat-containing protein [Halobaculum limi]|uniref:homing endonuclease associated repeat-containing protein n=1 Tax=Halobaculum limi TaxID=3031916 RepID=UPI002405EA2C|nr:HNH endonuclease [Halobaculum sp. YSMS11]